MRSRSATGSPRRLAGVLTRAAVALAMGAVLTPAWVAAPLSGAAQAAPAKTEEGFRAYVAGLWPQAQAAGVSRATFDAAFEGVTLNKAVLKPAVTQAEFVKPIWSYMASAASAQRVANGRALTQRYASILADLERRTGVDRYVVMAIWGMETSYGASTGGMNVIRQLASLAYAGFREEFFRKELIAALVILQQGHAPGGRLTGSWAGAMGQTQFMPSSFMKYAVDYDGDGHKNIWTSHPDALASTAAYLAAFGWKAGQTWGYEVILPAGFDISAQDQRAFRPFSHWAALGLRRADGVAMPTGGTARLRLFAGAGGPAFLLTENFAVIKEYNRSDAYALGVAHLSDRLAGSNGLAGKWPSHKPLARKDAMEIQRRLNALGYQAGKVDGMLGDGASAAIAAYQRKAGMVADGYPSHALLARLRGGK